MGRFYELSAAALLLFSVVALYFDKDTAVVLAILSVTASVLYLGEPYTIVDKYLDDWGEED